MSLYLPDELTADRWQDASRRMLAKALAEFSYEELLVPSSLPGGIGTPSNFPSGCRTSLPPTVVRTTRGMSTRRRLSAERMESTRPPTTHCGSFLMPDRRSDSAATPPGISSGNCRPPSALTLGWPDPRCQWKSSLTCRTQRWKAIRPATPGSCRTKGGSGSRPPTRRPSHPKHANSYACRGSLCTGTSRPTSSPGI